MAGMDGFAVIDSEEAIYGELSDGRTIFVALFLSFDVPEDQRDDPEYWLARLETGEFDDPENVPIVWTEKDGVREWRDFPHNKPDFSDWEEEYE